MSSHYMNYKRSLELQRAKLNRSVESGGDGGYDPPSLEEER